MAKADTRETVREKERKKEASMKEMAKYFLLISCKCRKLMI